MPRRVAISDDQVAWLRQAKKSGLSYAEMAAHIGCCEDTLKRILVRNDIATFSSEKYNATAIVIKTWTRPCNRCGDDTPRPRFQFTCDDCHAATNLNPDWSYVA